MKRAPNTAAPGPAFTWWLRIRVMTVKELLQLSRDAVLIVFFIYGFTLDVYLAGSGVSLELTKAAVTVMDFDRTPASRELAYRFRPPPSTSTIRVRSKPMQTTFWTGEKPWSSWTSLHGSRRN